MIVYSALAQSLIEAASGPSAEIAPRFADLVLLVNPAVEAARYLPIYDLAQARRDSKTRTVQPPVFICATAKNDWATGWAFPIGNAFSFISESWRGAQERQAMVNTMGHLPWMQTHALDASGGGGYAISESLPDANAIPFWIVQAAPSVIDGHNHIFMPPFLRFVADQVFRHVQYSRSASARAAPRS